MSRVPVPTSRSTRTPAKPPSTPARARTPVIPSTPSTSIARARTTSTTTPARTRTKSTTKSTVPPKPKPEDLPPSPAMTLSIKEAIALKRAEAKKAKSHSPIPDDTVPFNEPTVEDDPYGRQSVKETIDRARGTGNLNLATRNLPCIPSILFGIHLNVKPEPLKSVPVEPQYGSDVPSKAWFDGEDLKTLKMGNNDVVEIQPEISMFGSLKSLDMHKNKLTSIPESIADLAFLTHLDLSHNNLTSIPDAIFALPELALLNLSHNNLASLPFGSFFAEGGSRKDYPKDDFFAPAVNRAVSPLPRILILDASHNKLRADTIDIANIPVALTKIDLSYNPLGIRNPATQSLVRALGTLHALGELHMHHSEIGDDAFPLDLTSTATFPVLSVFQIEDTAVTPEALKSALKGLQQPVTYEMTTEMPPEGTLRVAVGKVIIKEPWEIEAEKRQKARRAIQEEPQPEWPCAPVPKKPVIVIKEPWETDAEEGLLTEGAKRRARAQAAALTQAAKEDAKLVASKPKAVVMEAWEIEAEQGLLTEGGKRRARAQAALKAQQQRSSEASSRGSSPTSLSSALSNHQYYDDTTKTLTLPPSAPPSKIGHARTFSLAIGSSSSPPPSDIALPTPTLPLTAVVAQPFSKTLRKLILVNRRMDRCFSLPLDDKAYLPNLEELDLEGCNLMEQVPVMRSDTPSVSGSATSSRTTESLLPLITRLFPTLQILNLSYNTLSGECLTSGALSSLILCTSQRKGLKSLSLRGNRITNLDGFKELADGFKGHRDLPGWKLDELDLRDNEIGRLPPELGLLPLDVFLVDGNIFRAPARRIWEREGTRGLLSWLRGRIE